MGMSRIHVAMFKNILHDQYSSEEEKYFGYVPVNEYGVLCLSIKIYTKNMYVSPADWFLSIKHYVFVAVVFNKIF